MSNEIMRHAMAAAGGVHVDSPDHVITSSLRLADICPTEAQVVAWLDRYSTRELRSLSRWNGCTLFENVQLAVAWGTFTWRELFDTPEQALAAFDDWRTYFDDLEIDE